MMDSQKIQALRQKIEELEKQEVRERQEAATWLGKLKHQPEVKAFEDRQLPDEELQTFTVNCSYLQHQYKSLLQRHTLLLNAFTDIKSVIFDEYLSAEADEIAQNQIEAIQEEPENRMETLQSKIKELVAESASSKENNANLSNAISTKLEEIRKLEARVNILTTDAEKSSAKIQELETARDALDSALKESTQSLSVKAKELSEMQSQYNMEKKRLEDELCTFRLANEMLNEMLNEAFQEEDEEVEAKRKEEEEIKRKEEEEKVRRSVLPRSNTSGGESSSAVFTPITCTESICKYMVKAGSCCYRYGLDINKYNVLAVVDDYHSVYLYSETNKREEKLCTCQYDVKCLTWNQQGTLLALCGENKNNKNNTIEVWDIPNRNITKRLKIKDINQHCNCLGWKGDTITAGAINYIYHWNINDQDNDQDLQRNEALLPRKTIQNEHSGWIRTVQWSNSKTELATITSDGDMCIYDEDVCTYNVNTCKYDTEWKLIHHKKTHYDDSWPLLQWCPWDNKVIATCCWQGYLKIWRVQQDIMPINEVKHKSIIKNIKWIPSKKAIITAHEKNQLVLWEYPSLSILQTIKGHTDTPRYLALNADKSAMVSKSDREMIFWKPFDEFVVQSDSEEETSAEEESGEEGYYRDGTDNDM